MIENTKCYTESLEFSSVIFMKYRLLQISGKSDPLFAIFQVSTHTYIHTDTKTDHMTPACLCACVVIILGG